MLFFLKLVNHVARGLDFPTGGYLGAGESGRVLLALPL